MFWNTFTNKVSEFTLNIWLVGCRQDSFLVACKIKIKDTVKLPYPEEDTAMEVIPESGFFQEQVEIVWSEGEKILGAEVLLHQGTSESAIGFMRIFGTCQM